MKGRGEDPQRTLLAVARAVREMALCWYLLCLFQWSSLRYRLICSSEQLYEMVAVTVVIVFIFNEETASQRLAVLLKITQPARQREGLNPRLSFPLLMPHHLLVTSETPPQD